MDKNQVYLESQQQIEAITTGEPNLVANLANIAAILKKNLGHYWVGFYIVHDDELVLGPFQGTPACVRIQKGKGVCGTAWGKGESQLVRDVHDFPGHIACDALSRSEIVVPVFDEEGKVAMVLDIDHTEKGTFDDTDRRHLEQLAEYIRTLL